MHLQRQQGNWRGYALELPGLVSLLSTYTSEQAPGKKQIKHSWRVIYRQKINYLNQEEEVKSTISIARAIVEVWALEAFLAPIEEVSKRLGLPVEYNVIRLASMK